MHWCSRLNGRREVEQLDGLVVARMKPSRQAHRRSTRAARWSRGARAQLQIADSRAARDWRGCWRLPMQPPVRDLLACLVDREPRMPSCEFVSCKDGMIGSFSEGPENRVGKTRVTGPWNFPEARFGMLSAPPPDIVSSLTPHGVLSSEPPHSFTKSTSHSSQKVFDHFSTLHGPGSY